MHGAGNVTANVVPLHSRLPKPNGRGAPREKEPADKSLSNASLSNGLPAPSAETGLVDDRPAAAGLTNLKIIRDRFVFDTQTGKFHRISETAAFLLVQLQRQAPVVELVTRYAERYCVPHTVAERDLELFLKDLAVAGGPTYGGPLRPASARERRRAPTV